MLLCFAVYSSHLLITFAIVAILLFMVLRNVVKIQMPNPTDMFVSNLHHYYYSNDNRHDQTFINHRRMLLSCSAYFILSKCIKFFGTLACSGT